MAADDAVFVKHYPQFKPPTNRTREHDQKLFDELSSLLSSNGVIKSLAETYSTQKNVDRRWVPQDWELTHPERFRRVVKQLHSLAGEIVSLHANLIRTGKLNLTGKPRTEEG